MNKELELWQFVAERLKNNQSAMLLIVAESSGSSPGRQGFKMAVTENDLIGSIGGGVMEVNLVEFARERLKAAQNETLVKTQEHRKNSSHPSGMICSGRQSVILFKLNSTNLKTVRQIVQSLKNNQSKTLQITRNDFRVLESRLDNYGFERRGENDFLYEEKIGFKNYLVIVGGGHCALALSELMAKMDFHISLFDDRPDLNTLAKNKFVHAKTIVESYEKIGDYISPGANVYVVVMTLGYKSDEGAIRCLLGKKFKYFGVLGSRAKMKVLLVNFEREGFPSENLKRIRTPIGIEINSRTPEEIAVSIAAEIIAVKNA